MIRRIPLVWIIAITMLALLATLVLAVVLWLQWRYSPRQWINRVTGMTVSSSAQVLRDDTTYTGPFNSDGLSLIELRIPDEEVQRWLNEKPLRGLAEWQRGPMSSHSVRTAFDDLPTSVYESPDVFFARRSDGDVLIIVDPQSGRVWLECSW